METIITIFILFVFGTAVIRVFTRKFELGAGTIEPILVRIVFTLINVAAYVLLVVKLLDVSITIK